MDLRQRLEEAGNALLAMLDREQDFLPTRGYEEAHDLGRWWDALLRLEETIGFVIPAELEAASLRNLDRLTANGDRLLMNRPDLPALRAKAKINPHNFRETLLAYGGLIRRRQSRWAQAAALQTVRALDRCLRPSDGRLDLSQLAAAGQVPPTTDASHASPPGTGWWDTTATSGRSLEALVELYQLTGEPAALALAQRVADHHLVHSLTPTGEVHPQISAPTNVGHMHSYLGTLRGLLKYGLLTQQHSFVEAVAATYLHGVRGRLVHESGWAPHDLGKLRFPNAAGDPVADPASCGDTAQLALWLALHTGRAELYDDAERLLRAGLLPAQLTAAEVRATPEPGYEPRDVGAWAIHGPVHGGKGCTPDVLAACAHTLCDLYRHAVTTSAAGVQVNLHVNHDDERLAVRCTRDAENRVAITVKQPVNLFLRLPAWAPAASIRLTVAGAPVPVVRQGVYAWLRRDQVPAGCAVVLTHALPTRRTSQLMPSGRTYHYQWRGDEITGAAPTDTPRPYYPPLADAPTG